MRNIFRKVGNSLIWLSDIGRDKTVIDLTGDRNIEWSWAAAHIPENPGAVLDFGCGDASLGLIAAAKGGCVTGIDLQQVHLPYRVDNLKVRTGDILNFNFEGAQFDVIINCSAIEHVGLAGRYGSTDTQDGDLIAMERMSRLLKLPDGIMVLTIPVGKDTVFPPLHRVYGAHRLNLLLKGFWVVKKEFWSKKEGANIWIRVSEEEALSIQPSEVFSALGLFILKPDHSISQNV